MEKASLEQAPLIATVPVEKPMLQQLYSWRDWLVDKAPLGTTVRDCSLWISPSQSRGKGRSSLQC